MEEKENWEQPENLDNVLVADAKIEENTTSSNSGSQYGKFKDADSLLTAYNNLQAEFTRKCQKLSELEKNDKENLEKIELEKMPIFETDDWQNKVSNFLEQNKDAKKYANDISNYILNNPELQNDKNALELAWAKVVSEKYKSPESFVSDDKFVDDFVMSNEHIKQKIISKYIQDLEKNKLPPFVTKKQGGNVTFQLEKKATTLDEAKELVEAILKSN